MTINEMMNEMEKTLKEINEIATEIKYKQKDKMDQFNRVMKHSQEWAFVYTQRVMTNHRKAEITVWYNQSQIALKRAKKIQAA